MDVQIPPYRPASLIERFVGALRLDRDLYTAASHHRELLGQAVMVVMVGGVMSGVGMLRQFGNVGVWGGVLTGFIGWFVWTAIVASLAPLFRCRKEGRSIMRPLGFATAPNALLALGVVPELAYASKIVVVIYLIATTSVAVQAAYGASRRRATVLAVTAFVVYLAVGVVLDIVAEMPGLPAPEAAPVPTPTPAMTVS